MYSFDLHTLHSCFPFPGHILSTGHGKSQKVDPMDDHEFGGQTNLLLGSGQKNPDSQRVQFAAPGSEYVPKLHAMIEPFPGQREPAVHNSEQFLVLMLECHPGWHVTLASQVTELLLYLPTGQLWLHSVSLNLKNVLKQVQLLMLGDATGELELGGQLIHVDDPAIELYVPVGQFLQTLFSLNVPGGQSIHEGPNISSSVNAK